MIYNDHHHGRSPRHAGNSIKKKGPESIRVPQLRERVFIIDSRDGKQFNLPEPTHFDHEKSQGKGLPHLTAWDAIGDLDVDIWADDVKPSGKWADLLPTIPEGHNYLWQSDKMGACPCLDGGPDFGLLGISEEASGYLPHSVASGAAQMLSPNGKVS